MPLILSRTIGETVVINGGEIRVTVADVQGDQVRLAFNANPNIVIDREEIHQRKLMEKDIVK